jgi:hypothetical protein
LRGIRHTAPYFHDNSAKTLEDVAAHHAVFFNIASGGLIVLTKRRVPESARLRERPRPALHRHDDLCAVSIQALARVRRMDTLM